MPSIRRNGGDGIARLRSSARLEKPTVKGSRHSGFPLVGRLRRGHFNSRHQEHVDDAERVVIAVNDHGSPAGRLREKVAVGNGKRSAVGQMEREGSKRAGVVDVAKLLDPHRNISGKASAEKNPSNTLRYYTRSVSRPAIRGKPRRWNGNRRPLVSLGGVLGRLRLRPHAASEAAAHAAALTEPSALSATLAEGSAEAAPASEALAHCLAGAGAIGLVGMLRTGRFSRGVGAGARFRLGVAAGA